MANILGARLDDGLPPFADVRRSNVFVYTFAPPNTVIRPGQVACASPRYGNIFNIVNPEDVVPLVPLAKWNACRFGVDLFLKDYDTLSLWGVWTDNGYNGMDLRPSTGTGLPRRVMPHGDFSPSGGEMC